MEFLKNTLHINVRYDDAKQYSLPNYIISRYIVRNAYFDKQRVFLLYVKTELEQVNTIKKHIQKLQSFENIPVVLVLYKVTARQRQGLIDGGVPFVVENKQCYLPFMGTLLTERCDVIAEPSDKLLPSAQRLLFYYILFNQKELPSSTAVSALGVSAMTITRAVRQLEQLELIKTYKNGVSKVITSDYFGKELYEKAKEHLICPIKRRGYIPKSIISDDLLIAGEQALSNYSMLNPPMLCSYACDTDVKLQEHITEMLIDDKEQVELQVWKYNPKPLSKNEQVDILSLAMCYSNDSDERIEEAVDEMLDEYWGAMNG